MEWLTYSDGTDRTGKLCYILCCSAYAAGTECCEWVQVGIAVYIPHKYQVKPHSSPWVSAVCAAVIAHRNHLLCLYKQNNSSASKGEVRQASYGYKRFLKLPKNKRLVCL